MRHRPEQASLRRPQPDRPDLIHARANADQPHMGLATWASSSDGKNYLTREELEDLGRLGQRLPRPR